MRRLAWLAACASACVACAPDKDQELAKRLEGHWYVEYTVDGGATFRMIGENRSNRDFVLRAREYRDGKAVSDHQESGEWNVVDGLYRTRTLVVNGTRVGRSAYYFETYEIVALDAARFEYRNTRDGAIYRARRVAQDHTLP